MKISEQIEAPSQVHSVSPSELAAMQAEGKTVELIDVRSPGEFAAVHAAGASLVPLNQLDVRSLLASRGQRQGPIYLICLSGARAAKARQKFCDAGFDNVICVEGGTNAWIAAGLPVVRGRGVIALERQVRIAAGAMVVIGVILGFLVHPAFFGINALVGAGLVFAGITNTCGMGMLLARMPWNRGAACKR